MTTPTIHVPVLCAEVVAALQLRAGDVCFDGTLGGGGHTAALARCVGPEGRVLAADLDPQAIERAALALAGQPVLLYHGSYADLPELLVDLEIPAVQGILLDLGLSSDQLADAERGFSFQDDGPLDLRFDPSRGEPASALLARLREEELADVIYQFGEERFSRRIARKIVATRKQAPLRSSAELARLVRSCVPRSREQSIDPATRTFQALRIAVNDELATIAHALRRLPDCLAPGGRIAVISFHSLEDRLVKHAFRDDPRLEPLGKRPTVAAAEELAANVRARSAKLRVAERRAGSHGP